MGIEWMRRHLAPNYKIHTVYFHDPNAMHIDTTLYFLKPGICFYNPIRPPIQTDVTNMITSAGWDLVEAVQPVMSDGMW